MLSSIFTMQRYASAVYAVIVCLSFDLSVTSRCSTKMAICSILQTVPYDSPATLVCWCPRSQRNSNGVICNGGSN